MICSHTQKKEELWLRYTKHLLMTLQKTYICNRQHSIVEETEVHTLSEKKNSGMEYQVGFSGEQFSSNLLSGWDHHALERVKL